MEVTGYHNHIIKNLVRPNKKKKSKQQNWLEDDCTSRMMMMINLHGGESAVLVLVQHVSFL